MRKIGGGGVGAWLELSGLERLGSIFLLLFVIQIMTPGKCQIGEWKRVRSRSGDK